MLKKTFSLFLVISCITPFYIYPVLIDNQSKGVITIVPANQNQITLQHGQKYRDDEMMACTISRTLSTGTVIQQSYNDISKTTILSFNRHDGISRNDHYSSCLHQLLLPNLYKGYAESLKNIDAVANKSVNN